VAPLDRNARAQHSFCSCPWRMRACYGTTREL
jgi:hypothetical protein